MFGESKVLVVYALQQVSNQLSWDLRCNPSAKICLKTKVSILIWDPDAILDKRHLGR